MRQPRLDPTSAERPITRAADGHAGITDVPGDAERAAQDDADNTLAEPPRTALRSRVLVGVMGTLVSFAYVPLPVTEFLIIGPAFHRFVVGAVQWPSTRASPSASRRRLFLPIASR